MKSESVWIPLAYPLPNRKWIATGKNEYGTTYSSLPWTEESRAAAEAQRGRWVMKTEEE